MKSKILSFAVIFLLSITTCSSCQEVNSEGNKIKFIGPGVDWLQKKVDKPYSLKELTDEFNRRNVQLSTYYANDEFEKIGDYYGEAGMVRTYYENFVYGRCAIADYFEELKTKKNVNEVKFVSSLVYIDVDEYLAENPSPDFPDKDIVYTIFEIISISYDIEGRSEDEDTSSSGRGHSRPTFR